MQPGVAKLPHLFQVRIHYITAGRQTSEGLD